MKKVLLFTLSLLLTSSIVEAQQFVSTDPGTRNVVLEQFTGLRCTWCPAGSKIVDDLSTQYNSSKIRMVGISIHVGGFANPGTGQPDYRTNWASPLPQMMGVTGYPSGAVNRTVFNGIQHSTSGKPAMSRSSWSNAAGQIVNQASPVNVAVKAEYSPEDDKIYVMVETYYTSNASASSHRLTVGVMQHDIWGPQTGSQRYPEMVDASKAPDEYRHTKMLRDVLTDQWGEIISSTTQGTYVVQTYEYEPKAINGIDMVPENLTFFAYVAESQTDIITGSMADVEIMSENQAGGNLESGQRPLWYDKATSAELKAPEVSTVAMYPNPVQDRLSIKAQNVKLNQISIFNMAGQQVQVEQIAGREYADFDLSALPSGVYVVKFDAENASVAPQKFVKK